MPIFLVLMVLFLVVICTPYVLLFWWLKPITVMGYLGVFSLGSGILLAMIIIIGVIQNHRANKG